MNTSGCAVLQLTYQATISSWY